MKKIYLHDFMFLVSSIRGFSIDLAVSHKSSGFECTYHNVQTISVIDSDVVISNFLYTLRFTKPDFLLLQRDIDNHVDTYKYSSGGFEVAFILEYTRED